MTSDAPLRLVLADDHALVLEGLRTLLAAEPGMHVLATATDGERLLEAVRRYKPDVVVMDLQMPQMSGLACLERIRAEGLPVRVLVLSAFGDAHTLRTAIEEGADVFVLKTDSHNATLAAIRQVAAGQLVFPQAARRWLRPAAAGGAGSSADPNALTDREESVLAYVAEGKSNADIADAMGVSESTVKFHLRNLFAKLGVANRTEAAARYHRRA